MIVEQGPPTDITMPLLIFQVSPLPSRMSFRLNISIPGTHMGPTLLAPYSGIETSRIGFRVQGLGFMVYDLGW